MKLPTIPSFRLDDKRALIIGSSSGIGVGCAVALADAGASVVLAARRIDLLDDLKKSLLEKGYKAEAIKLDITKIDEVIDTIKKYDSFCPQYLKIVSITSETFFFVNNLSIKVNLILIFLGSTFANKNLPAVLEYF